MRPAKPPKVKSLSVIKLATSKNLSRNGDVGRAGLEVVASLGALEIFPTEIMIEILRAMDIPTLIEFSAVNRRAKMMLDLVLEYRFLIAKCPKVISACVAAKANSFSCLSLYNQMSLPQGGLRCQIPSCDRRGELFWLLTGSVLCGSHLHHKMENTMMPTQHIWYNNEELRGTNHIILKSPHPTGPRFIQVFDLAEFRRTMPVETHCRLINLPYGWGYRLASVWIGWLPEGLKGAVMENLKEKRQKSAWTWKKFKNLNRK